MKNAKDPVIFIIDNCHLYREIVRNCLEALYFKKVYTFSNCEEIPTIRVSPDIIILDHEFGPNKTKGLEFFRTFRSSNPNVHFIFFSSIARIDIAVESIKSGALDYIIKSKIGLDLLMKRLTGLIASQLRIRSNKIAYNAAMLSLSMVSLIFIVAIILYNRQII